MRVRNGCRGLLTTLLVAAAPASADVSLHYDVDGKPGLTVRIHGTRIGVFEGGKLALIYADETKSYVYVDHRDRVYTVISEEWLQEATRRGQQVAKQMQDRMEQQSLNLPPQYRQMYQQGKMMTPFMTPMMNPQSQSAQPAMHVPAFGPGPAGAFSCRRMDVMQGGKRVQQVCVANPAALNIDDGDWNTFRAWLATSDRLARQGAFTFGFKPPVLTAPGSGLQGVPVEVQDHAAGTALVLSEVDTGAVAPEALQPPGDYLEARIPMPGL